MRVPNRLAEEQQANDIAERLLTGMASGLMLYRRKVAAGTGIDARRLTQTWIVVRPVIRDGIVEEIVEDAETDAANRVGRLKYGIRPTDVRISLLRQMSPDLYWLGARGMQRVADAGQPVGHDLWRDLRPAVVNHVPAHDGRPASTIEPASDPKRALAMLKKGDREALAALLDGLHLVDTDDTVIADGRRSERRTWKPLRPVEGMEGLPIRYEADGRVSRHTVNAGRNGFSPRVFATIAPLLEDAGYEPVDAEHGHAYRLSGEWIDAARKATGWMPETGGAEAPSQSTIPIAHPSLTVRQAAIVAMLEGRPYDPEGEAPTHSEIAEAIAVLGSDRTRCARLIEAAMGRVASNERRQAAQPAKGRWWTGRR